MHSAQPSELNITDHYVTQIGIVTTKNPFQLPEQVNLAWHLHPAKLSISNETLYALRHPRAMPSLAPQAIRLHYAAGRRTLR